VPTARPALILTAGLGTRLRPLTSVRAKPAIPVNGVPMVRRIIASLAAAGVTELVLNLHHLPETLARLVGDGRDLGVTARYSWEPVILGSAGGPRRALPLIGADTFFIVNGDTLTNVDLRAMAAAHDASGALVTMALVENHEPDRYGGVLIDAGGGVTGFARKGPAAKHSFHFVGVQIAHAAAFRDLPDGEPINSVGRVYDELVARQPGSIRGFMSRASFADVGTPADYMRTSLDCAAAESGGILRAGRGSVVDPAATLTRTIVWDDVTVGAGCVLEECIVTDGVRVPPGSSFRKQILVSGGAGQFAASFYD
jgi:NDP-sugar pyrophosphorylase family protein